MCKHVPQSGITLSTFFGEPYWGSSLLTEVTGHLPIAGRSSCGKVTQAEVIGQRVLMCVRSRGCRGQGVRYSTGRSVNLLFPPHINESLWGSHCLPSVGCPKHCPAAAIYCQ